LKHTVSKGFEFLGPPQYMTSLRHPDSFSGNAHFQQKNIFYEKVRNKFVNTTSIVIYLSTKVVVINLEPLNRLKDWGKTIKKMSKKIEKEVAAAPAKEVRRPTESELEILHIVWKHGLSSVKFVHEQLSLKREIGYTTALKTMQVMYEKGLLKRQRGFWKSHDYEAAVGQSDTQNQLLTQFVETAFGGSVAQLVMQALGSSTAKTEDLSEIKSFLKQIEGELKIKN
jgi:BlaI family transcriptional regulator, penicillinase repressor